MGFVATLLNFIVVFSLTLGLVYMSSSILALILFRENIPSYKEMFFYNIIASFLISVSFVITINFLPNLYKVAKINSGTLILKNNYWKETINITVKRNKIHFNLCKKNYKIENNMLDFYNTLNKGLLECPLNENDSVYIFVLSDPFKDIQRLSSNSMLAKYIP